LANWKTLGETRGDFSVTQPKDRKMNILTIEKYEDFGHALPDFEKSKLALALKNTEDALTPKSELIVVETIEDRL